MTFKIFILTKEKKRQYERKLRKSAYKDAFVCMPARFFLQDDIFHIVKFTLKEDERRENGQP